MSFYVHLYRKETMERQQQANDPGFFENPENLEPFTAEQFRKLSDRLAAYKFAVVRERPEDVEYQHPKYNITVLLTKRGLYFNAGWDPDSMFEAGMTASEFTDSGEFRKYDPQNGGWEAL